MAPLFLAIRQVINFRVVMALTTSASVTAAVAGPMAYQANRVQNELAATEQQVALPPRPEDPITTTPPETPEPEVPPVDSTTTTEAPEGPNPTTPETPETTAPTTSTTTPPSAPTITAEGLMVSLNRNQNGATPILGARLYQEVFIFYEDDAEKVTYWIDDPSREGTPAKTTSSAPFFLGDDSFDVSNLDEGNHELTALIETTDGTEVRSATFTVTYG